VLRVELVRHLSVANPDDGRPPFMSAASGVARAGDGGRAIAIGDDENHFWEGEVEGAEPGSYTRIIPGVLSADDRRRKSQKPDLEALTILPPFERNPNGALLACGSGGSSKRGTTRSMGVAFTLDADGRLAGMPCRIGLEPLHSLLGRHVTGELNLEGICVWDDHVVLAQRGNSLDDRGRPAKNQLLMLSREEIVRSLLTDLDVDPHELLEVADYDLGHRTVEHDGREHELKLDFTDLDHVSADPRGRIAFTAAAEGIDGSPLEGVIAGSAVGLIDPNGSVERLVPLADAKIKLEGVDARYHEGRDEIELLLVADADDPDAPAPLLRATLPGSG
jgi:hypothetical protein